MHTSLTDTDGIGLRRVEKIYKLLTKLTEMKP